MLTCIYNWFGTIDTENQIKDSQSYVAGSVSFFCDQLGLFCCAQLFHKSKRGKTFQVSFVSIICDQLCVILCTIFAWRGISSKVYWIDLFAFACLDRGFSFVCLFWASLSFVWAGLLFCLFELGLLFFLDLRTHHIFLISFDAEASPRRSCCLQIKSWKIHCS